MAGADTSIRAVAAAGVRELPAGPSEPAPRVVDNSWYEHTVACVVPHPEPGHTPTAGDGSVRLSVSLNGQQYTHEDVRFSVYRPVEQALPPL